MGSIKDRIAKAEAINTAPEADSKPPAKISIQSDVKFEASCKAVSQNLNGEMTESQSRAVANDIVIHDGFEGVKNPCILLLGQTGGGKSSIANALLGKSICKESSHLKSCTDNILVASGHFFGVKEPVTVVDTPGFLDSENRDKKFLVGIVEFLRMFPKNKLGVIIITLPLLANRADRTYYNMIDQIELLLGGNIWESCLFVTTMEDNLSKPEIIKRKRAEWEKYLVETCYIERPVMCNFNPAVPETLDPVRSKYLSCKPTTPAMSAKIDLFVESNPGKSPTDAIAEVEQLKTLQDSWEEEMRNAAARHEQTLNSLREAKDRCARDEAKLRHHEKELETLQKRLAEKPEVVYRDVHHHHHHGGCVLQ